MDFKLSSNEMESRLINFLEDMSESQWELCRFDRLPADFPDMEKVLMRSFVKAVDKDIDDELEFVWAKVVANHKEREVLRAFNYSSLTLTIRDGSDFTRAAWILEKRHHLNPRERNEMMLAAMSEAVRTHDGIWRCTMCDCRQFVNALWDAATTEEKDHILFYLSYRLRPIFLQLTRRVEQDDEHPGGINQ